VLADIWPRRCARSRWVTRRCAGAAETHDWTAPDSATCASRSVQPPSSRRQLQGAATTPPPQLTSETGKRVTAFGDSITVDPRAGRRIQPRNQQHYPPSPEKPDADPGRRRAWAGDRDGVGDCRRPRWTTRASPLMEGTSDAHRGAPTTPSEPQGIVHRQGAGASRSRAVPPSLKPRLHHESSRVTPIAPSCRRGAILVEISGMNNKLFGQDHVHPNERGYAVRRSSGSRPSRRPRRPRWRCAGALGSRYRAQAVTLAEIQAIFGVTDASASRASCIPLAPGASRCAAPRGARIVVDADAARRVAPTLPSLLPREGPIGWRRL
jgi:hypothetical protein